MHDERGLYYLPYPQNPKTRMYVKQGADDIYFRLWNQDDPQLWEDHDWVPYGAIRQATRLYRKTGDFDPAEAYDLRVAKALIAETQG